jgi:hypothetical protein
VKEVALVALALLGGCGMFPPDMRALSADADGVSFAFPIGEEETAERQAALYCANLGRRAALESTKPSEPKRSIAVFRCR